MVVCGPLGPYDPDDEHPDDEPAVPRAAPPLSVQAALPVLTENLRGLRAERAAVLPPESERHPPLTPEDWAKVVERMERKLRQAIGVPGVVMEGDRTITNALTLNAARDAQTLAAVQVGQREAIARADLEHGYTEATGRSFPAPVTDSEAAAAERDAGLRLARHREIAAAEARNYDRALDGPARATAARAWWVRLSAVKLAILVLTVIAGVVGLTPALVPGVVIELALLGFFVHRARRAHARIAVAHSLCSAALERSEEAEWNVVVAEAGYVLAGGDPREALPVPVSARTAARRNHRHGTPGR